MPGAIIVRSDVERKALFGVGETETLPADAYSEGATLRVYAAVADRARRILIAGHSVIVDAVSARPDERETLANVAKSAGFPLHGLFLTADIATRLARVGNRAHDASDAAKRWRARRRATIWGRSTGRQSTRPAPRGDAGAGQSRTRFCLID